MERRRLERVLDGTTVMITPERVQELLANLGTLLEDGASGALGSDSVHRAANVFCQLVGGRIFVHVVRRPGRKRVNVRGTFVPKLLRTAQSELGSSRGDDAEPDEVEVWLRKPPKRDEWAVRVHQLIDEEGVSYRAAAKVMQSESKNVNSGVIWQIYRRYYEMVGQPVPNVPYNNGEPRKERSA